MNFKKPETLWSGSNPEYLGLMVCGEWWLEWHACNIETRATWGIFEEFLWQWGIFFILIANFIIIFFLQKMLFFCGVILWIFPRVVQWPGRPSITHITALTEPGPTPGPGLGRKHQESIRQVSPHSRHKPVLRIFSRLTRPRVRAPSLIECQQKKLRDCETGGQADIKLVTIFLTYARGFDL